MKRIFLILSVVMMGLSMFVSCKDDKVDPVKELKVNKNEVTILLGKKAEVKITDGNEGYKLSTDNKVKASIKENVITIEALEFGKSVVTVTDSKDKKVMINVTVSVKDIALSSNDVSIKEGENTEITITEGSGSYSAKSDNNNATVKVEGTKITITGAKAGDAVVTVTDTKTNKTTKITVKIAEVIPDVAVNENNVEVKVGENVEVNVTAGSGTYTAKANNDNVTVVVDKAKITITGAKSGDAVVTVTDTKTNKTVDVTVTIKVIDLSVSEDVFIDYKGEKEIRLYNNVVVDINTDEKKTKSVNILSGSGDYKAEVTAGADLAEAVIENNSVKITSKDTDKTGEATVVLTDNVSLKTKTIKVRVVTPLKMSNTSTINIYKNLENNQVTFLNYLTSQGSNYDHIDVSSNKPNIASVEKVTDTQYGYMGINVKAGNTTGTAVITITDQISTVNINVEVEQAPDFTIKNAMNMEEVSGILDIEIEQGQELENFMTMLMIEGGSGEFEITPKTSDVVSVEIDNSGYLTITPKKVGTVDLIIKDKSSLESKTLKVNIKEKTNTGGGDFIVTFTSNDGATFDGVPVNYDGHEMEGTVFIKVGKTGKFTLTGGSSDLSEYYRVTKCNEILNATQAQNTGYSDIEAKKAGTCYLIFRDFGVKPFISKYYKIVVTE